MLSILRTPNTSVSPSATMKSHDAWISPSRTIVRKKFIGLFSRRSSMKAAAQHGTRARAPASASVSSGASLVHAPLQACFTNRLWSVALGALHAALDPVQRLDPGWRIDAFSREVLDVDEIDPLGVGIILGPTERDRLDRLVAVGQFYLDETAWRLPLQTAHRGDEFIG